MVRFLAQRLFTMVVLLLAVSILGFMLVRVLPGNPATSILGLRATPAMVAQLTKDFGYDQPLVTQYLSWLSKAVRGDLGYSLASSGSGNSISGVAVSSLLVQGLKITLPLALLGTLIAVLLGTPLGVLAASREGKITDHAVSIFSVIGLSVPDFFLAFLFILLFTVKLGLLPSVGSPDLFTDPTGALAALMLPALTIGIVNSTAIARTTRAATRRALHTEFVRLAQARGAPRSVVVFKHALKNALVPVVTVVGIQFGYVCSGVIVVESVFALPGNGRQLLVAITQRDYPTIQALILLFAIMFALANLLADAASAVLDPRIRTGAAS